MRLLFGLLSLVVVLAAVTSIGKTQLKALSQIGSSTSTIGQTSTRVVHPGAESSSSGDGAATVAVPGGVPGATAAAGATVEATVPMQVQTIQNNVVDRTNAALQQGIQRNKAAQP